MKKQINIPGVQVMETVKQASERTGLPQDTIRKQIMSGEVVGFKGDSTWLYVNMSSLNAFMKGKPFQGYTEEPDADQRVLKIKDAAKAVGLPATVVRALVNSGAVRGFKTEDSWLYANMNSLNAYLSEPHISD